VHGSERCFRKFLNAARFYDAQLLILGGARGRPLPGRLGALRVRPAQGGRRVAGVHGDPEQWEKPAFPEEAGPPGRRPEHPHADQSAA